MDRKFCDVCDKKIEDCHGVNFYINRNESHPDKSLILISIESGISDVCNECKIKIIKEKLNE